MPKILPLVKGVVDQASDMKNYADPIGTVSKLGTGLQDFANFNFMNDIDFMGDGIVNEVFGKTMLTKEKILEKKEEVKNKLIDLLPFDGFLSHNVTHDHHHRHLRADVTHDHHHVHRNKKMEFSDYEWPEYIYRNAFTGERDTDYIMDNLARMMIQKEIEIAISKEVAISAEKDMQGLGLHSNVGAYDQAHKPAIHYFPPSELLEYWRSSPLTRTPVPMHQFHVFNTHAHNHDDPAAPSYHTHDHNHDDPSAPGYHTHDHNHDDPAAPGYHTHDHNHGDPSAPGYHTHDQHHRHLRAEDVKDKKKMEFSDYLWPEYINRNAFTGERDIDYIMDNLARMVIQKEIEIAISKEVNISAEKDMQGLGMHSNVGAYEQAHKPAIHYFPPSELLEYWRSSPLTRTPVPMHQFPVA